MSNRLAGKVALISGSTRGIGRSLAECFASEGAAVAVTGRSAERGQRCVERIHEAGGTAAFFPIDIADEDSVRSTVAAVADHFGGLTTLVNNAAPTAVVATTVKPMAELTTEEWRAILEPTLTGAVFWPTKYAWPFLAASEGASILNVSSGQSLAGFAGFAPYAAAKGGVNSLTKTLAVEGSNVGIRCNTVVVGRVVSSPKDSTVAVGEGNGGRLTRIGSPMDIAWAATWLVSDEAGFVTGATVVADGGFSVNGDATLRGG